MSTSVESLPLRGFVLPPSHGITNLPRFLMHAIAPALTWYHMAASAITGTAKARTDAPICYTLSRAENVEDIGFRRKDTETTVEAGRLARNCTSQWERIKKRGLKSAFTAVSQKWHFLMITQMSLQQKASEINYYLAGLQKAPEYPKGIRPLCWPDISARLRARLTSRPVRMCRASLTLAKLPFPMVLSSR